MRSPEEEHIADRGWSEDPVKLFANMYELTEALCHNYWYVLLSPLAWSLRRPLRPLHSRFAPSIPPSPKVERVQSQIAHTTVSQEARRNRDVGLGRLGRPVYRRGRRAGARL